MLLSWALQLSEQPYFAVLWLCQHSADTCMLYIVCFRPVKLRAASDQSLLYSLENFTDEQIIADVCAQRWVCQLLLLSTSRFGTHSEHLCF